MADAEFWDKIADKYAASPVDDPEGYAKTLAHFKSLIGSDARVLELGCGTGTTALELAPHAAHYTASDFSARMIGIAQDKLAAAGPDMARKLTFIKAEPGDRALGAAPYDVVIASSFLHLVPDLPGTLAAIHGHLVPGGLFLSKTVCLGNGSWFFRPIIGAMRLIGKAPYVNILKTEDVAAAITAAGFTIEDTRRFGQDAKFPFIAARRP